MQEHVADYPLAGLVTEDGRPVDAELTVIEWKHKVNRELVLCDRGGCTLATRRLDRFPAKGFNFTGYLKCDLLRERQGALDVDELDTDLTAIIGRATEALRDHFRKRAADQARALVEQWKAESVYPFDGVPASPIEQAERQVFDVVALNVNEFLPTFAASDQKAKRFSFQMLRSAIEESPSAIRRIVQEFLELPTERRDELIDLLDRTSLDSMITASKLVLNRLEFLAGLEVVLFDHEAKKKTKERKHLHRLLAPVRLTDHLAMEDGHNPDLWGGRGSLLLPAVLRQVHRPPHPTPFIHDDAPLLIVGSTAELLPEDRTCSLPPATGSSFASPAPPN